MLEGPLHRELQHSRSIQCVDALKSSETVGAVIGDEVTGLVDLRVVRISAGITEGCVLNCVYAVSVLHVVVCVIQCVKSLHLEREALPFRQMETTGATEDFEIGFPRSSFAFASST